MCLADLGPVLRVAEDGATAEVQLAGGMRSVSLAPLVLEGRTVAVGQWVLVHTGLAVEVLEESEAAEIVAVRTEAGLGGDPEEES